jgi:hypothetical protein
MTQGVVDANVPIVANGRSGNHHLECQLACVDALERIMKRGKVFIDDGGAILEEYTRYLYYRGQPGVGDAFFRFIIQNQANRRRVRQIALPLRGDTADYVDYPDDPRLATFDRSDRKYAVCARKSRKPVLNAVDSDWLEYRVALDENGIEVRFLCGTCKSKWFSE